MARAFQFGAFQTSAFQTGESFVQTPVNNYTSYRSKRVNQPRRSYIRPTRKNTWGFVIMFAIGALLWS
jgi:hypothetical protein